MFCKYAANKQEKIHAEMRIVEITLRRWCSPVNLLHISEHLILRTRRTAARILHQLTQMSHLLTNQNKLNGKVYIIKDFPT